LRLAREALAAEPTDASQAGSCGPAPYRPGLRASPLFADFSEEELLTFVSSLRLVSRQPETSS